MSDKPMWMVRAGRGTFLFEEFREKHIVAIGWNEIGDGTDLNTIVRIKLRFEDAYPDLNPSQKATGSGQFIRFRLEFKIGDFVITYNSDDRTYLVGEITGEYSYNPEICDYAHIHKVKWYGSVDRDSISTSSKNSLGAISTIFKIPEHVKEELVGLLKGEKPEREEVEEQEDEIKEDVIEKAHEFIKDKILALSWSDMQDYVAGLLRAMGYKTIVSAKGPDRGKDIVASPDGLGMEDPRIRVEVKHRKGSMGAPEIRSFTGGLTRNDKGLYVSSGGFNKEAHYEAERCDKPLTLIDSDMLVELTVQYYDNFDSETKTLVPLTKIYWPS